MRGVPVDQPAGGAVLHVSSEVRPEVRLAFDDWCDTVHHFDTMRVDGFLSLRRFDLVEAAAPELHPGFGILTIYQVAQVADADPSSPSYQRHSASYVPPPPGVADGIRYERVVYRRLTPVGTTQPVGRACVSLLGRTSAPDDGLRDAWARPLQQLGDVPGVLASHLLAQDDPAPDTGARRYAVLVDVEDLDAGRAALEAARLGAASTDGACESLGLFSQAFPTDGVLLRDRLIAGPR